MSLSSALDFLSHKWDKRTISSNTKSVLKDDKKGRKLGQILGAQQSKRGLRARLCGIFCQLLGNTTGQLAAYSALGHALRASDWSEEGCGSFHPVSAGSILGLREAPSISLFVHPHQLLGKD